MSLDMDSGAIGWTPQIKSWVSKVARKCVPLASLLEKMLLDFLHDALAVVKSCNQPLYLDYWCRMIVYIGIL